MPGGYQVLYDAPTAYDKVLRNDEFDWQMANPNKARSGVWMRHTLAGLESGSKYHVRVAGVNAAGTGAFATVATTAAAATTGARWAPAAAGRSMTARRRGRSTC